MCHIHHVSENQILNQGCSQNYNNNGNIEKLKNILKLCKKKLTVNSEDGKSEFSVSF